MHFHQRIVLFALTTCIAVPASVTAQRDRRNDAAVYAAITNAMLDSSRAGEVLVRSVTRPEGIGSMVQPAWERVGRLPEVDSVMAEDFKTNSMAARPVPSFLVQGKAVWMITDSVIESLEKFPLGPGSRSDDGWADFRKRFPNASGILSFDGIGYSADGQYAVAGVSFGSMGTGSKRIVILHQIDGKWSVTRDYVYLRA